jgi:hypothetical protein
MAAMIVLKMGARSGYADQVGMTHPLARLFMIAIISVVAIGVFWWLKRELGDHTRQDFTHSISEIGRRGREGYQRGQDAYDRARDLNSRAPWANQSDTSDEPDQPLTGPPVNGRPPGGRPPSSGSPRRPTPVPTPSPPAAASGAGAAPPSAPVAGAGAADGATVAGEAATAVVAPEAVAGAAVASQVTRRLRRDHSHGARADSGQAAPPSSSPQGGAPVPNVAQPAPAPATGRAGTTRPTPTQRATSGPASDRQPPVARPQPDRAGAPLADTETPAKGR